jgi:hypothetical protein
MGRADEFVHDRFDAELAYQEVIGERVEDGQSVVMTTWHEDESLEEAAEFFRDLAFPSGRYASCDLWIAAAVGHSEWAARLRATLT